MNIAVVSCASLVVAVIVGGVARVNVGVVALGFAWLIGYYVVGLPVTDVVAGFPLGVATALFGGSPALWVTPLGQRLLR
jgi:hypothetical protein